MKVKDIYVEQSAVFVEADLVVLQGFQKGFGIAHPFATMLVAQVGHDEESSNFFHHGFWRIASIELEDVLGGIELRQ